MDVRKTITRAQAAARLKVAYTTIVRAIERGELRTVNNAAGEPMLSAADVDAWGAVERKPGPRPQKAKG